mmetsp:Transcript_9772/g.17645  ORF Transcript_9772/g.17645 Transcript_9772/m.17645 type:complete len:206 (-) Transcript_9772:175-792(-)
MLGWPGSDDGLESSNNLRSWTVHVACARMQSGKLPKRLRMQLRLSGAREWRRCGGEANPPEQCLRSHPRQSGLDGSIAQGHHQLRPPGQRPGAPSQLQVVAAARRQSQHRHPRPSRHSQWFQREGLPASRSMTRLGTTSKRRFRKVGSLHTSTCLGHRPCHLCLALRSVMTTASRRRNSVQRWFVGIRTSGVQSLTKSRSPKRLR